MYYTITVWITEDFHFKTFIKVLRTQQAKNEFSEITDSNV